MLGVRYRRSPSEAMQALLKPGGFLSPLIEFNRRSVGGVVLDIHMRAEDEVHVYCGLTTVFVVKRLQSSDGRVAVSAHRTYAEQPCADGFIRQWCTSEEGLGEKICAYLGALEINTRFTEGEGEVQSRWSQVREPWVPFDREGVLEYRSGDHRAQATSFPELDMALDAVKAKAERGRWRIPGKRARKIDQLAVDPEGHLVLIELKEASANDDGVYYAPLQLLQYVWEWHSALEAVRPDLQSLIESRAAVGLTPGGARLSGGIRAAIGFGTDRRTDEVRHRYEKVLDIVNLHLPDHVYEIETWQHAKDGPSRVE